MSTPTPVMDKLVIAEVVDLRVYEPSERSSGKIEIAELCDCYFRETLTKAEYIALGNEILQQAELL